MMRRVLVVIGALCAVGMGAQQAVASTYTNPTSITIPDQGAANDKGAANPYPGLLGVTDSLPGPIADVNVTLNGLSHTCMSDLRFLLVSPGGQNTILLSTTGAFTSCDPDIVGGVITLDDEAPTSYPCNAAPSGTFKPTAEPGAPCTGPTVAFSPPAPPEPYPVALTALDGGTPNGNWSLFIFDQFNGDRGILNQWSLDILPTVSCAGRPATVGKNVGTLANDVITGTPGPDVLIGLGGNDTINGLGGKDVICGGVGNDKLFGGPGKDILRGEAGSDRLNGQGGKDTCVGGPKADKAKACE